VSCRFINKIYNLPSPGTISSGGKGKSDKETLLVSFPKGNYTMNDVLKKINNDDNKVFSLVLVNDEYNIFTNKCLVLNNHMAVFFGINNFIKKQGPMTQVTIKPVLSEIYINCDIVDQAMVFNDGVRCSIFNTIILNEDRKNTNYSPNDNHRERFVTSSQL